MCALNSHVHNLESELDCTFVLLKQICCNLRVRSERNQDSEVKEIRVLQQIKSVCLPFIIYWLNVPCLFETESINLELIGASSHTDEGKSRKLN